MINVKAISTNVGKALLVSAFFMFVSLLISIAEGCDSAFTPLLISFIITAIVGAFPFIFVRNASSLSLRDGYLTIFVAWLLSFVFGMLPYVLWGGEFTIVNAWFESVSGYTTTGATILNDVEALPRSLLFWRSSTHFIGGLGVVVFLLMVMPSASPFRLKLTNMEMSSLSKEGYRYNSSKLVRVITSVYICLIIASCLAFWAAGMSLFDAVNHAFSVASTGGFSTRNLSIAYYDSDAVNVVALVFMVLSAMHFGLIYSVFVTRSLKPMNNPVVIYYLLSIIVMTVLVTFVLMSRGGYDSLGTAAMHASFNVVSYMTTTGFAICDNASWPFLADMVLMVAAIQCGCSGSTTGGLKVDRVVIAFKAIMNELRHKLHPTSVSRLKMGRQYLPDSMVGAVCLYIVLYMIVVLISCILVMLTGVEAMEAVSGTFASIGNIGPGLDKVSAMCNYSMQPAMAKLIFTFDMFLGRLEIFPVLIVLSFIFKRDR